MGNGNRTGIWILLVASLGLGCASRPSGKGPVATGDVKSEEATCSRDRDCTLMDDCCGCEKGGMQVGVHLESVQAAGARQEVECANRHCPGTPSQHRSCQSTAARCLGGRCVPAL